jgi:hypothetical protein
VSLDHVDDYSAKKREATAPSFVPHDGFRFEGDGRGFRRRLSIIATNQPVEGSEELRHEGLLARVGTGSYVGRIRYTYPINESRSGDFTSTIVGDSYPTAGGKLAQPLKPNTVRSNDHFISLFQQIIGVTCDKKPALVWSAEETVVAPELAVRRVHVENIADFAG